MVLCFNNYIGREFCNWLILLACIGLHRSVLWVEHATAKSMIEARENDRFDKDLLYHREGGYPLFLVNPEHTKTMFFIEGFRAQMPAGMYKDWFEYIHQTYRVNIIVPVYGLQSSPFAMRNREWFFQEDMRTVLQIYDAYTSILPKDHKVVTVSMSFGTVPHLAIAAKAKRPPAALVFLSPLNTGMEYKVAGRFVYWLSKQTSWLQYVILFSPATRPPTRASIWDIVNREKNLKVAAQMAVNPEDSSRLGYLVERAASWMEKELIHQVKGKDITVVWGDSDLFFSQDGFKVFTEKLMRSGNRVKTMTIKDSGHMVLLDNGGTGVKQYILKELLEK